MIETIGKYRIDSILGTGAMGVVYKAYDANIARVVALKTIRSELFEDSQEDELIARFKNEAQASGRLAHPNIVAVYDYGEIDSTTYIAMEFVEGTPLNVLLVANVPMDLNAGVTCMTQLLRALDYAHSRGVVHRDIKPANLLITADAQVKITDFGIARLESSTLTQVGAVIGTPSYMSPEQFRGEAVDGRSDIFSAGVVLYQMLTGVRPFIGTSSAVMHQILNETPVNPSERQAALNPAFDAVMHKALSKNPDDRYQSALAFLDALTEAHQRQTGGVPLTEEDNERTIMAFQKPLRPRTALAQGSSLSSQTGASRQTDAALASSQGASSLSALTITPWKLEIMPELQLALAMQIGPVAKLLLKNAAAQAVDVEDLCNKLLPHISSEQGRTQFLDSVKSIKKKLEISTLSSTTGTKFQATMSSALQDSAALSGNTQLQLSQALMEAAEQKLTIYIGPIAKVMVKRTAKITGSPIEFFRLLSENVANEKDRGQFLKDVSELRPT